MSTTNSYRQAPLEGRLVRHWFLNEVYALVNGRRTVVHTIWQYDLYDKTGQLRGTVLDLGIGDYCTYELAS